MTFRTGFLNNRNSAALLAVLIMIMGALMALPARAELGAATRAVPAAALVGEGRMTFLGFRVFDAELYAPGGSYKANAPFALRLTYLRNFKGSAITKSSIEEIQRQGVRDQAKLERWKKQMRAIFPNVSRGQSITGVRDGNGHAVFYLGQRRIGTIADREFTRRFFAIWLGSNTKDPALRDRLIGRRS